ncbi:MAG: hypothetical protein L0211_20340 [Planctomycetaceae bacterium]|nr:hypothetical protein [Planctomycetaceae bacterium]
MTSQYRPSPFTSHPTVVMQDTKSEPKVQPQRKPYLRWALYVALALSVAYAVWAWTR